MVRDVGHAEVMGRATGRHLRIRPAQDSLTRYARHWKHYTSYDTPIIRHTMQLLYVMRYDYHTSYGRIIIRHAIRLSYVIR